MNYRHQLPPGGQDLSGAEGLPESDHGQVSWKKLGKSSTIGPQISSFLAVPQTLASPIRNPVRVPWVNVVHSAAVSIYLAVLVEALTYYRRSRSFVSLSQHDRQCHDLQHPLEGSSYFRPVLVSAVWMNSRRFRTLDHKRRQPVVVARGWISSGVFPQFDVSLHIRLSSSPSGQTSLRIPLCPGNLYTYYHYLW